MLSLIFLLLNVLDKALICTPDLSIVTCVLRLPLAIEYLEKIQTLPNKTEEYHFKYFRSESICTSVLLCSLYVSILSYRPVFGIYQVKLNPCSQADRWVDQHLNSPHHYHTLLYCKVKWSSFENKENEHLSYNVLIFTQCLLNNAEQSIWWAVLRKWVSTNVRDEFVLSSFSFFHPIECKWG